MGILMDFVAVEFSGDQGSQASSSNSARDSPKQTNDPILLRTYIVRMPLPLPLTALKQAVLDVKDTPAMHSTAHFWDTGRKTGGVLLPPSNLKPPAAKWKEGRRGGGLNHVVHQVQKQGQ